MGRYQVDYRFYLLAKVGIGIAYLWYVLDFLHIHLAAWAHPSRLLLNPAGMAFVGSSRVDPILREQAELLNGRAAVWTFVVLAPVAVGLYLWGRGKWIQLMVGAWLSLSMIALASLSGCFASAADLWLHLDIVAYVVAALVTPDAEWREQEPGISRTRWRKNATFGSVYAALVVWVQFSVYVFAGVNKLVFGWDAWTHGTAIQQLAFDSSVRAFARGIDVPYVVSLVLCYLTLFQRLVAPLGFFVAKYQLWSLLVLGTMHIGYAILLNVNLFPVVGISSLLMVWPASGTSERATSPLRWHEQLTLRRTTGLQVLATGAFIAWLILEPLRVTSFGAMAWENKLMVVPAWSMFADGGKAAGGTWRLLFLTKHGNVDVTDISLEPLPHSWRDRFVVNMIFHELATGSAGPNSLAEDLLLSAKDTYLARQHERGEDATILRSRFDLAVPRSMAR